MGMRILHLVNSLNQGNGITNVVVDLSVAQSRSGNNVMVASRKGFYNLLLDQNSIGFTEIDFVNRNPMTLIKSLSLLKKTLHEFRPDIIHCHTITPLILNRLLGSRIPTVATVHNEWERKSILMRWADLVVGVSPSVSESMIKRGVAKGRMKTVSNGATGSPRRSTAFDLPVMESPAVLYVGALRLVKGTDVLLESFRKVHQEIPEAHLYLVGNNDLPVTEQMLSDLGLNDVVHIMGLADPYPYYAAADLFVLPSRSEAAGLVILEGMESGLPVIGTRVGGIVDFLDKEGGGLTVPGEAPEELGEAIIKVLKDDDLREHLTACGRKVATNHSVDRMAEEYAQVYLEARSL